MKVALCLHGIVGGTLGKNGQGDSSVILDIGHRHTQKHIININDDIDVFIHTWSIDQEHNIRRLYRPKNMRAEKQIRFQTSKRLILGERHKITDPDRNNNHYSKWYSAREVMRVRQEYEEQNNVSYDMVILTRFDIAWQTDLDCSQYDPKFFYAPKYCFYAFKSDKQMNKYAKKGMVVKHKMQKNSYLDPFAYWAKHHEIDLKSLIHSHIYGKSFWDCYFFSSPRNMDKMCSLYDRMDRYIRKHNITKISNHKLVSIHIKKTGLLPITRYALHFMTDAPLVRGWYWNTYGDKELP